MTSTYMEPEQPVSTPVETPVLEQPVILFVENYQQGTFVSGVDGAPPITVEGTPVPADKVDAVIEAAGYANVALGRK